ncbi:uncharacterized protein LOC122505592 [Leptopilina heterotoma]|uniref:uncharacterized protein LOC122505592 n=1 Tax=Leptopilina heterotoma TaxID=63436 RepID=UPI001CA8097D|nr:uncharacterized protein LOC122505592 [Leptopilina heterotoma]
MLKLTGLFLAFIAAAYASEYKITLISGNVVQGKNAKGVVINAKKDHKEIEWQEKFDNDNSLTVHYMQVSESTGQAEYVKIDNLCNKYESGTLEHAIKHFVLKKFGKSDKCSIKKRNVKVKFPIKFEFQGTEENTICGPTIGTFYITRNNDPNLLFSSWLRGSITGEDCK